MAALLEPGPRPDLIGSLAELVQTLERESRPSGYTDAMLRYAPSAEELEAMAQWDIRHYTRHCIHQSRAFELLLICYLPGQRTSIHDYDSQMAWIKPIIGRVREERFRPRPGGGVVPLGVKLLTPGDLSYLAEGNPIHRHTNVDKGRTMTLNLYSRPIRRWRVYDERTGMASLSGINGADAG